MTIFTTSLSSNPWCSPPHPRSQQSGGDLQALLPSYLYALVEASLSIHVLGFTSSRTSFHWPPFSSLHLCLFILYCTIPVITQTWCYCSNPLKSCLEPTSPTRNHLLSLLPLCSKILPPTHRPTTILKPLVSGYLMASVLPRPMINITSHLTWPLSSTLSAGHSFLRGTCSSFSFLDTILLVFLQHHWLHLFGLLCWILLFPQISQFGVSHGWILGSTLFSIYTPWWSHPVSWLSILSICWRLPDLYLYPRHFSQTLGLFIQLHL